MNDENERFLGKVIVDNERITIDRFKKGVKEHGGKIWLMGVEQAIANLDEELADARIYLKVVKEHVKTIKELVERVKDER